MLLVLAMAVAFAIGAWLSVQHVNVRSGEMTGHRIAVALLDKPLGGSGLDGSPARLPMYMTAALYAVVGPSVPAARLLSIAAGAAAVVLTFVAGRRWFGPGAGLLAATLLAVSPYFLNLARTAMSEGDAFWPGSVLIMLLAFDAWLRRRDSSALLAFAVTLGVALAVQVLTALLVPALVMCDLLYRREQQMQTKTGPIGLIAADGRGPGSVLLASALLAVGLELLAMVLTQLGAGSGAISCWAAGLVTLIVAMTYTRLTDHRRPIATASREGRGAPFEWLTAAPLAAAVCLAICPQHVLQSEIPRAVVSQLAHQDAGPMVRFLDPVRLYVGIILIKPGLPLGLVMLAGLGWAWRRSTASASIRLLVATSGLCLLLLMTLPVRRASWLMGVYPLLVLILAAFIVHVARSLRGQLRTQSTWIAFAATACLYLAWGTFESWPDFGLYGYRVVGNTWLGAESRGHRNLIEVTNDGTEDALRWCRDNVPPDRRVVSYLWDDHVIDAFVAAQPLDFELVRRHAAVSPEHGPPIDDADYLIMSLNNEVSYHDLPPPDQRAEHFEVIPVHIIWRGRNGYRIPFVQIYQRRGTVQGPTGTQGASP